MNEAPTSNRKRNNRIALAVMAVVVLFSMAANKEDKPAPNPLADVDEGWRIIVNASNYDTVQWPFTAHRVSLICDNGSLLVWIEEQSKWYPMNGLAMSAYADKNLRDLNEIRKEGANLSFMMNKARTICD